MHEHLLNVLAIFSCTAGMIGIGYSMRNKPYMAWIGYSLLTTQFLFIIANIWVIAK